MAKDKHCKLGDRNTKFFHALAVGRRRKKQILQLKVNGRLLQQPRAIKQEILKFYKNLYKQPPIPSIHLPQGCLPTLSDEQAINLERMPTGLEIKQALQSCDSSKSPGYDGFNMNFIKHFWEDLEEGITSIISHFFSTGSFPQQINTTWVALIPKTDPTLEIKNFRPVSMVGCIYKIIAKILAIRLRRVMPSLIGESQSAFISDRNILDSALVANEAIWWLKKSKQKAVLLKLDFEKAFDTVRWSFIEGTMTLMGFGSRWRQWIMTCVTTATMSIIINGTPSAPFHLQRGLRQGDPLSPFLFLIVAEAFNNLVRLAKQAGKIEGIRVGRDNVELSHLQFADDTLIFSPADHRCLQHYKFLLACFSIMSGMNINFSKSSLIPIGCDNDWVEEARSSLQCSVVHLPTPYLGVPLGANPRRVETWKPVIKKVEDRLSLWKARLLSRAGRLTLIKVVLNSLPLYYLSLFKIPKQVAAKIINLQRRFFWCSGSSSKGIPFIPWEVIQRPKELGGLGVGNLVFQNTGLLFKWWWRFAKTSTPLWKIPHHGSLIQHKGPPSVGKQLLDFRSLGDPVFSLACSGMKKKVGDGTSTLFWEDVWIGDTTLKSRFPRLFSLSQQQPCKISEMGSWVHEHWEWDLRWRRQLFVWEQNLLAGLLLAISHHNIIEGLSDECIWIHNPSGIFSVSSFSLQVFKSLVGNSTEWRAGQQAWKGLAPPKAELLTWFILQGRLNTKSRLKRINCSQDNDGMCALCNIQEETLQHLFFSCPFSSLLWSYCSTQWNLTWCLPTEPVPFLEAWLGAPFSGFDFKLWTSLFYVVIWSIWWIRNKMVFENFKPQWDREAESLLLRLGYWSKGWCPVLPFEPDFFLHNLDHIRAWSDR